MKHKLAHLFGWNYGVVESFYIGNVLWTGFRCTGCNTINNAKPSDFLFRYTLDEMEKMPMEKKEKGV